MFVVEKVKKSTPFTSLSNLIAEKMSVYDFHLLNTNIFFTEVTVLYFHNIRLKGLIHMYVDA